MRALVSKGRVAAYKQTHARILLLSDENQSGEPMMDQEISRALKVGTATVERVRRRCVEEGVEAALGRREQLRRRQRKLDGQSEAHLIAMAISQPPEGTGQLDHANAGRRIGGAGDCGQHQPGDGAPDSEKNELKPWLKECWCLPPQGSAEFVCAMEDVLEVYHREYQDNEVLVCLDETSKQLVQGDPATPPAAARGTHGLRSRIPAKRGEQPVHAVRALGGMAAGWRSRTGAPGPTGLRWCGSWWMRTTPTRSE